MRKIENTNDKAMRIVKLTCIGFGIYCTCYLAGRLITTVILYSGEIKAFMKRVLLKMTSFFKSLQNKLHPTKISEETKDSLAEFIARAEKEGRCKVMSLDDLDEFDCSEE